MHGFRPGELVFVLGHGEERALLTRHYFYYYRQLKRSFLAFQVGVVPRPRVPDPGARPELGPLEPMRPSSCSPSPTT